MDSRNGALETALFYGLSMLLVVRVIQQNDFASWAKVALSLAIFLEATTLPLTVDFLFLHAGAGPVFWTVLAQVIPVALPFLFFLWLASVTRNMIWFLAGVALAFPVVSLLDTRADLTMDDAEQLQAGPWNLYLTQGFLAAWVCGIGLAIATGARLFAKSVRAGWVLGLITLAVSFWVLVGWSRAYPSLIYRAYPPIPTVSVKLPPDYFKPITWEPDDYGICDVHGNYTRRACADLNRIPTDDGPFPVVDSIQAKFIPADGQWFDLCPPQVTSYYVQTIADVLAQRYPGVGGGGTFPLFRFTHELREKLRGKRGTLVLALNGRMVNLVKRAEASLRQDRSERLTFPNGTALVWQTDESNGSMRDWHWIDLHVACRSYQPGYADTIQMGEGRILYVLSDAARRQAGAGGRKFYPAYQGWMGDPWYTGWHIDLSDGFWSVDPGGWMGAKPKPQFILPVDRLKLTIIEAQSWERFTASITIPDFAIPVFPPDQANPPW
jgi:hypothetical protein